MGCLRVGIGVAPLALVRGACRTEQVDEEAQVRGLHVTELAVTAGDDLVGQVVEERRAGPGDRDGDDAAVVGTAVAADQTASLEPVEEPGNVRGPRHQPAGEGERWQRVGGGVGENPQGVVLLGGEVVAIEDLLFESLEQVVGPPHVEVGLLLGRIALPARRVGTLNGDFCMHRRHRRNHVAVSDSGNWRKNSRLDISRPHKLSAGHGFFRG